MRAIGWAILMLLLVAAASCLFALLLTSCAVSMTPPRIDRTEMRANPVTGEMMAFNHYAGAPDDWWEAE